MEWSLILFTVVMNIIAVHLCYFFIYRDNPTMGWIIGFFASAAANTTFFFVHPGHAFWPWNCTGGFWKDSFVVIACILPLRYLFTMTWLKVIDMKEHAMERHFQTHHELSRSMVEVANLRAQQMGRDALSL